MEDFELEEDEVRVVRPRLWCNRERLMYSIIGGGVLLVIVTFAIVFSSRSADPLSEEAAAVFLKDVSDRMKVEGYAVMSANWNFDTNMTDHNEQIKVAGKVRMSDFFKGIAKEARKFPREHYEDPLIQRALQKLSVLSAEDSLPSREFKQYEELQSAMKNIYATAHTCYFNNRSSCNLGLQNDLLQVSWNAKEWDEMLYYWTEWTEGTGYKVRDIYHEVTARLNAGARLGGFDNNGEIWLLEYDDPNFFNEMEELWESIEPLFNQLHAYMRRRLSEHYGEDRVSRDGPIPAHVFSLWGTSWENMYDISIPFPDKPSLDIKPALIQKGFTERKIFETAEDFFLSLGMPKYPDSFWNHSIFSDPKDGRIISCHPSAYDFFDGKEFRIIQCTKMTNKDYETAHHEMGHIAYAMLYKQQSLVFRAAANPGFHEALGDCIGLSATTPSRLHKLGLLDEIPDDHEDEINQLYLMALKKITLMPYALALENFRFGLFKEEPHSSRYNCRWWFHRERLQGIEPPINRTSEDFDLGSKFHVAAGIQYLPYFVSYVLQFQFLEALCISANQYDPAKAYPHLSQCDIYGSKVAGQRLRDMMQLGSSKPWPDALEVLTGQRKMDTGPLLRYFHPLMEWLVQENTRTGEFIGWKATKKDCGYHDILK